MDALTVMATSIGTLVVLSPLAYVSYLNGGGLYYLLKRGARRKTAISMADSSGLVCSIDADCPPGYTCVNGTCMSPDS